MAEQTTTKPKSKALQRRLTDQDVACCERVNNEYMNFLQRFEAKHGYEPSQHDVAEMLGWKQPNLSGYLGMHVPIGPKAVIRFARLFDVPPEKLRPEIAEDSLDELAGESVKMLRTCRDLLMEKDEKFAHAIDLHAEKLRATVDARRSHARSMKRVEKEDADADSA